MKLWSGASRLRALLRVSESGIRNPRCFSAQAAAAALPAAAAAESPLQQLQNDIEAEPMKCTDALDNWLGRGNTLGQHEVGELLEWLQLKEEKAALKFMRYFMDRKPPMHLTTNAYLRHLRLGARVYDAAAAEKIYNNIPSGCVNEEVTAGFLRVLLKKRGAFRAENCVRGLQKKPTTSVLWEAIIRTYFELNMHERMLASFNEMKVAGLEPTLVTYVVMLKYQKRLGGVTGIEDEARAAVEKVDVESEKDQLVLIPAMEIYSLFGEGEMVDRLWRAIARSEKVLHDGYMSAIGCFGRVGKMEQAEEVLGELLQLKCVRGNPYRKLADAYGRLGMVEKAEEVFKEKVEAKENFFFNSLIVHYVGNEETVEKGLKMAKEQVSNARTVSYEAVTALLPVLEGRKDWRTAKTLAWRYLLDHYGDVKVFNGLLKVYAAASRKVDKLLVQEFEMVEPNEETMLLLASLQEEESAKP